MDVHTTREYFTKVADDGQKKKIAVVGSNSNSNMNTEVAYLLLNLVQPDGTCQTIQLTEVEAKCLGIFVDDITFDNTNSTTNSTETTMNLTNSVENSSLMQPEKPLYKVVTHHKKPVNITTPVVDICNNGSLNGKKLERNILPYPSTMMNRDGSPKVITNEASPFGMFLNNSDSTRSNIENIKTITTNYKAVPNTSLIKHPNKAPARTNRKIVQKKAFTDICSLKLKPKVSLSPAILHGDGTSKVVQLTTQQTKTLRILPTTISVGNMSTSISNKGVIKSVDTTENIAVNSPNANSMKAVKHLTKYSNNAIRRKNIVNLKNITSVDGNGKNSNQKQKVVNIYGNSTANENSERMQLSQEDMQTFGISNGATNSVEASKNVIRNAPDIVTSKPIKYCLTHPHKPISRRKKTDTTSKNSAVDVCNDISTKMSTETLKPLGSCENPIEIIKDGEVLHSTQNLSQDYLQQIAEALQFKAIKSEKVEEDTCANDKSSNIIYRVVYPEELDLKPKPKQHKKGRPKKRSLFSDQKPDLIPEETKPPKNMRTRSGRITRPPQHIQKDFRKIETSEVDNMETDLKTIEFEPLTTNQPPTVADTPIKINQLENHQRKRSIASQFRCPKCKKAYLGRTKMLKHLQKHPDHGPIPDHCKVKDDETWNFLMDVCNKRPIGQKGLKFCKELVNFLRNVRVLAKMFFRRPTCVDKNLYFVDNTLSSVFGIESGNYVLNENELHTEVSMLSFLNSKCFKDDNTDLNEISDAKLHNENFDLDAFVETCQTTNHDVLHENLTFSQNEHHNVLNGVNNNDFNHKLDSNENNKNSKSCGRLAETNFHDNKLGFDTIQSSEDNGFGLNCDITSVSTFNSELQKYDEEIISSFTDRENNERKNTRLGIHNSTSEAHEATDHQKSINSDLSLHSELLSDNSLLNSLPNLRTSVEELMLNNVDSTQVTNLLDNSTSSDEVMNVDQFVNERFKNLTESDLELPNTSLNLDLPSLDLFQFHTS